MDYTGHTIPVSLCFVILLLETGNVNPVVVWNLIVVCLKSDSSSLGLAVCLFTDLIVVSFLCGEDQPEV